MVSRRGVTAKVDGEWFRNHDDLEGLGIRILMLRDKPLPESDITRLIEAHPIREVFVLDAQGTDAVALALANCPSVRLVDFRGSDLTDDGIQKLPLERLNHIAVSGTPVTGEGLYQLRRCRELEYLELDGRQVDGAVDALIDGECTLDWLFP